LRFNYDQKDVDFERRVSGGPANPTAAEREQLLGVYRPQAFRTDVDDSNASGQSTLQFAASDRINAYATYATAFKSVGVNLGGCRSTPATTRCSKRPRWRPKTSAISRSADARLDG
jgi:iron complex outermembrane receptor protein